MILEFANLDISNSYAEWKEMFDAHGAERIAAGCEIIYMGHKLDNEQKMNV